MHEETKITGGELPFEHKELSGKSKARTNYWTIISAVLAVLLVASLVTNGFDSLLGNFMVIGQEPKEAVAERTISFINQNLLQGQAVATLTSVEEKEGLYSLRWMMGEREMSSYITKDGQLLFPQAIPLTEASLSAPTAPSAPPTMTKSDKPVVDLYVMSFCPFGNKAEETMYPVYKLLKDKVEWNVHYIVSVSGTTIDSLHGQPEADEDMREVCVKENYGMDAFWKFMSYVNNNCGSNGACWIDAAKDAGADASVIEACVTKKGLDYMKAEADASDKAGARGSPTLLINGQQSSVAYQYGQVEAYKAAICSAFNTPPEECSKALASSTASATASATSGSCG